MPEAPSGPFPALWITDARAPAVARAITIDELTPGELLVRVSWSGLNYKDALAVMGAAPIARRTPLVPGIDLAGEVVSSTATQFRPGSTIIAAGAGIGESVCGGYARYTRIPAALAYAPPAGLDAWSAMAFGTAGLTAALCVAALEARGMPPRSAAVVSGASGGVGTFATMLLARAGHRVSAISGKPASHERLRALGAVEVLGRDALTAGQGKQLLAERWWGGVDTVGGSALAGMVRSIATAGAVAACGMAGGGDLPTSVYPFILRGVGLLGISSSLAGPDARAAAWSRLAREVSRADLEAMTTVATLDEVPMRAQELLASRISGRVVVRVGER